MSKLSEIDDLLKMIEGDKKDDKKDEPKKDAKKDEPKSDKKDGGEKKDEPKKDKKDDKKGDGKETVMGAGDGTAAPPKEPPKAEIAPPPGDAETGDGEKKGKKDSDKKDKKDAKNECDEIDQPREVPTPADPAGDPEAESDDDDDDEDKEMSEALCIPTEAYRIAVEEYRSITEFLEMYRAGNDNCFSNEIAEGDSPAMIEKKERPPKGWFQSAVKQIEKDPKVDDPAAVAAHIWHNWAGPKAKKKMKAVGSDEPAEPAEKK